MKTSGAGRVIVIGAGIVGVAAAIWLQRAGRNVLLIDKEGPAAGASFGNAGVLAAASVVPVQAPGLWRKAPGMLLDPMKPLFLRWPYLPKLTPFLMRFLANGSVEGVERIADGLALLLGDTLEQHQSLAAGTGAARYVVPSDYLMAYASKAEFDAEAGAWEMRRRRGFRFTQMTSDELADYDPALKGRFGHAVSCHDHGMISDPGAYVKALARHFTDEGGEILKAEVTDLMIRNGRASGVMTKTGAVEADELVLTAGAWSAKFAAKTGARIPLDTERGYHIEFPGAPLDLRAPVMVAAGKFVATPMEGRIRCAGVVEFGGLEAGPSEAPFRLIERHAFRVFPELKGREMTRWMGFRPTTTDSLPVIGPAPGAANLWLGYGHQHVGLTGGAKTGRWLAQMITGERVNSDLAAFSPARGARLS